ncbi:hypothetical protein ABMA28_008398 [Loxostege sticticalis]|uniref:Uncharacterized protein n=1 Tax=Loxostege sticticalis TaxID=481309 RepID=A0ABD0SH16_LOXSC
MAMTCIHDNRMICASTVDGCSRRSFLDQCDMYEYNCDYGTRYQETYRLLCSIPLDQNDIHQVTTIRESCNKTRETPTESTKCCERPVTWETTTEKEEEILTQKVNSTESTAAPTTWSTTRSTTKSTTSISTSTPAPSKIHIDITTTDATTTDETTKKPVAIESGSSVLAAFDSDKSNFIHEDVSTESTTTKSTTTESTTAKTSTSKTFTTTRSTTPTNYVISSVEKASDSQESVEQPNTQKTKFSMTQIRLTKKIETKTPYKRHSSYSWWYPTSCNSMRCQRPVTWETTTKRRINYHGRH